MPIDIETIEGTRVTLDESSITLLTGPYANDVGPHTYVYTSNPSLFVTTEEVGHLAARLPNIARFAVLTRPNLSGVHIRGSAVSRVREAIETETPARTVVFVGRLHQAVMEDLTTTRRLINDRGGTV